jgi:hypothetical protein
MFFDRCVKVLSDCPKRHFHSVLEGQYGKSGRIRPSTVEDFDSTQEEVFRADESI